MPSTPRTVPGHRPHRALAPAAPATTAPSSSSVRMPLERPSVEAAPAPRRRRSTRARRDPSPHGTGHTARRGDPFRHDGPGTMAGCSARSSSPRRRPRRRLRRLRVRLRRQRQQCRHDRRGDRDDGGCVRNDGRRIRDDCCPDARLGHGRAGTPCDNDRHFDCATLDGAARLRRPVRRHALARPDPQEGNRAEQPHRFAARQPRRTRRLRHRVPAPARDHHRSDDHASASIS